MTPHQYWRVYITQNAGQSSYSDIAEIKMLAVANGINQCTGGTAIASGSFSSGYLPSNAFDGNAATSWASPNGNPINCWIGYEFTSNVAVESVVLTARSDDNDNSWVTQFYLQSSDDSNAWTNVYFFNNGSMSQGTSQTFTITDTGEAQLSKLTSYSAFAPASADLSKLTSYSALAPLTAQLSKLTSYSALAPLTAQLSKLTLYAAFMKSASGSRAQIIG
jgi:hypothetical protein